MTHSTIELSASAEDHQVARLAALAIALSAVEAALPSPLPGVKPGIANIVILLVLYRFGFRTAVWVALLRVVGAGLLFGGFLSPGFVFSLAGACCSLFMLALTRRLPRGWFGPVTHSVAAAIAHVAGQLLVVYFWLIPQAGLLYLVPLFAGAAVLFGAVNGVIAARLLQPSATSLPALGALGDTR